jgi:hypothetical protein
MNTFKRATDRLPNLDQRTLFMDKRVIPPVCRHQKRITGKLHLPVSPHQNDDLHDGVRIAVPI